MKLLFRNLISSQFVNFTDSNHFLSADVIDNNKRVCLCACGLLARRYWHRKRVNFEKVYLHRAQEAAVVWPMPSNHIHSLCVIVCVSELPLHLLWKFSISATILLTPLVALKRRSSSAAPYETLVADVALQDRWMR